MIAVTDLRRVRGRRLVLHLPTGCGAGAAPAVFVPRGSAASALVAGLGVLAGTAFLAVASVLSRSPLSCPAGCSTPSTRSTRPARPWPRLAVAEERLRFGHDLHDVLGRNLAVIALKNEPAVQLARRGRPEAVPRTVEVQRLGRESQREVREIVRGCREAGPGGRLAGAGVLAGGRHRVHGHRAVPGRTVRPRPGRP